MFAETHPFHFQRYTQTDSFFVALAITYRRKEEDGRSQKRFGVSPDRGQTSVILYLMDRNKVSLAPCHSKTV